MTARQQPMEQALTNPLRTTRLIDHVETATGDAVRRRRICARPEGDAREQQ
jgi:transcriptional regulator NrdR family protein